MGSYPNRLRGRGFGLDGPANREPAVALLHLPLRGLAMQRYIIELMGMPRAGKSEARRTFQRHLDNARAWRLRSHACTIDRSHVELLIRAGVTQTHIDAFLYGVAAQQLAAIASPTPVHALIMDGGLNDSVVWMRALGVDPYIASTWARAVEETHRVFKILFVQPAECSEERGASAKSLPVLKTLEEGYRKLVPGVDYDLLIDGTHPLEENLEIIRQAAGLFLFLQNESASI